MITYFYHPQYVKYENYMTYVVILFSVASLDIIILILIIISSIKCMLSFGKGLKEILVKQALANEISAQLSEL